MSRAFGVAHKCGIPVGGIPMLQRVLAALSAARVQQPVLVSIDDESAGRNAAGPLAGQVTFLRSATSAPASARAAAIAADHYPLLVTTADHALLTPAMLADFQTRALASGADFVVGLATAEIILAAYPQTKRTFIRFGHDRVSGCNLFAVLNRNGLALFETWSQMEKDRKRPWKLVAAFGIRPLLMYVFGRLTLEGAFAQASKRLRVTIKPVLLPFAEAAIDVDKPSDHALAEAIISKRQTTTGN